MLCEIKEGFKVSCVKVFVWLIFVNEGTNTLVFIFLNMMLNVMLNVVLNLVLDGILPKCMLTSSYVIPVQPGAASFTERHQHQDIGMT